MILVTGGTGLLGSHLLYFLLTSGKNVRALKRNSSDLSELKRVFSFYSENADELLSKIEWHNADILIPESLEDAFAGVSFVYHCAAMVSFNPDDKAKLIKNNLNGTANIVDACIQYHVKKLVHVSSTAALGKSPDGREVSEEMIWTPDDQNTGYSISKFKSEMEVWRGMEEGLNMVIVNPSVILGPGFWSKGSSLIFKKINAGLRFYTTGGTGFVGVNDVVRSMVYLMESDISGERFIINSENLSYKNVFTMMAEAAGVRVPNIEATPFLGGLAWRLDTIKSWFGFPRAITKEAIAAGRNTTIYSNKKVVGKTNIKFESIKDVILSTTKYLKQT
ncbi:MAG: NAD-dependent epimerase/dehydratase family protein [Bacteroidales bacterium]|nr:NAD-dependent epimerase/dehydratase family protein [Bacteroidales bacterium]MCF8391261.1 NAD-dependent epimerase/dehydratase family protein [Bacteroidales bacterium]